MSTLPEPIALPLPLMYLGSVNVWLLTGDPLTLVDTGPSREDALVALQEQLALHGFAIEDIELVLLTHHHLDHTGLATTIRERSGATIAAHRGTDQWGRRWSEHIEAERKFTLKLIGDHGVPGALVSEAVGFFEMIVADGSPFDADLVLSDGDTVRAGDRTLRTVFRPGHSTTDTLYVDTESDVAFVGDHLLAKITTGAELMPTELPGDERRRALMEYLGNLRKTQVMPLRRCYPGHGPTIDDHGALIEDRIAFHAVRLDRIHRLVGDGCSSAFDISRQLWSEEVAASSPVLVVWEVLGHLDMLVNRGLVLEEVDDRGVHRFRARQPAPLATPSG